MKNIVCLIFFSFFFLFGIKMMNVYSSTQESIGEVCFLQEDSVVSSSLFHHPDVDMFFAETNSLLRQFRTIGRSYRQFSIVNFINSKIMSFRLIKSYLDTLLQSIEHFYTSLPRQCWSISSEHYVFGMRRILI